jgi:flavodoxin
MNALVLYDSRYGNTERIAEAVALALQEELPTRLAAVDEVDDCAALVAVADLLVVGGPTHRHGVSDPLRAAVERLDERALDGVRAATFDTRLHGARVLTGSAAVRLGRLLRHRGAWLVVPPASFLVDSGTGPLGPGELDHAREWAQDVLLAAGLHPRRLAGTATHAGVTD